MITLWRIPPHPIRLRDPVVVAIGIFDGVHLGHRAILKRTVRRAKVLGGTPVAVTFHPHPLAVLAPKFLPPLLISTEERLNAFSSLGIRVALVIPFNWAFSRWSPEKFVRRLLVERLRLKEVVVGHDFGFGHGREGSIETLRHLGRRFGFKVHVQKPVVKFGGRIASHRIRSLITQGNLEKASVLLGRPVSVEGRVIRGTGRGQRLGFPTANLRVEAGVLPPNGVYAVTAQVGSRRYPGMANLGFRPTFQKKTKGVRPLKAKRGQTPLLEAHLFGVNRSLYRRRLKVFFLKWLRSERRFPSPHALARQLARDAQEAINLLCPRMERW